MSAYNFLIGLYNVILQCQIHAVVPSCSLPILWAGTTPIRIGFITALAIPCRQIVRYARNPSVNENIMFGFKVVFACGD